ncbi:MAG: Trk system potassium transporter TrkA [Bacteroidales bacterium]|nr:Trk system potassium transporter TrkA [Bacteroidales bacterium]
MRIIIAGAGEVGRYLAKRLSTEEQEIVLVDESSERMSDLDMRYDLDIVVGSPTSPKALMECDVPNCELFIAVTPEESINTTAAILAKNLGAKKTVARVNNYEFILSPSKDVFHRLGVDTIIYPETLAALEIVKSLQRSWMREYRSFGNDALQLACVKVRSNATFLDKPFMTGYFDHKPYRVVAIKRNNKTIIPKGADQIQTNDIVYFICPNGSLDIICQEAGKEAFDIRRIMIMGCSRIAIKTVYSLPKDFSVKVIDNDREKCYKMATQLQPAMVIHGDGRDLELLREEGLEECDAFVAVTNNSETNVMACMAAKRHGIKKTIAEVENLDYLDLVESLDIGTIINKKLIAGGRIYQMTLDEDALDVQSLTYSDAEVVEFVVKPGDKITSKRIRDLHLPDNVNIGGIVRDGNGFVVNGSTVVLPGDHVVVFCKADSVRKIAKFF